MKLGLPRTIGVIMAIAVFLIVACNTATNRKRTGVNKELAQNKTSDYELADECLLKLRKDKVDTIIFCKRTCINCCDFFNIFWTAKGKKFLNKFYFDFSDMRTHSVSIELKEIKVFDELNSNYSILKTSTIKDNGHKQKNGRIGLTIIDHYCYSQISIFTATDSIKTDRIKDHSFEKYTAFDQSKKGELNNNYLENGHSKWNSLLKTIELQLKSMPETSLRELQTLRIQKVID